MTDRIPEAERLKAAFLADYERICRKHQMMVFMMDVDSEEYSPGYSAFVVAVWTGEEEVFGQSMEEMRLENLRTIEQIAEEEDRG